MKITFNEQINSAKKWQFYVTDLSKSRQNLKFMESQARDKKSKQRNYHKNMLDQLRRWRMTRLTKKDKNGIVIMTKPQEANNKLAELEDVLEENYIESAEELRYFLNFKNNMAVWDNKVATLLKENEKLTKLYDELNKKYYEEMDKNIKLSEVLLSYEKEGQQCSTND